MVFILMMQASFCVFLMISSSLTENIRKVSKNLGCTGKYGDDVPANHVDVLIPEVIQVLRFSVFIFPVVFVILVAV